MRWLSYFILAYLIIALQIGLAPYVAYQGAAPNLVLLAVIFIAINAPRDAALLGCFALGVMQDLLTQQPPGLFALAYGLIAMFVVSTQQVVYREHPLTHFTLVLVGGLMTSLLILAHGWVHPPIARLVVGKVTLPAIRLSAGTEFTRVLYTALLAPIVLGILQRLKRIFGFHTGRRSARAW